MCVLGGAKARRSGRNRPATEAATVGIERVGRRGVTGGREMGCASAGERQLGFLHRRHGNLYACMRNDGNALGGAGYLHAVARPGRIGPDRTVCEHRVSIGFRSGG